MKVGLRIAVSENFIKPKAPAVYALSQQLEGHFADRSYSDQVKELDIALLMPLTRPGYEDWYQPKWTSYIENKDVKSKLTGEVIPVRKRLQVEFRLDESSISIFLEGSELDTQRFLLDYLADHFEKEVKLPTKVKSFALNAFVADLKVLRARLGLN